MMNIEKVFYKGEVKAMGGRNGVVTSSDNTFNLKLTRPKETGDPLSDGTNPEQLFAAAFAGCFVSSLEHAAKLAKVAFPAETSITCIVGTGKVDGGHGIEVELKVSMPGVDKATTEAMIEQADKICPYANAIRGNVKIEYNVVVEGVKEMRPLTDMPAQNMQH